MQRVTFTSGDGTFKCKSRQDIFQWELNEIFTFNIFSLFTYALQNAGTLLVIKTTVFYIVENIKLLTGKEISQAATSYVLSKSHCILEASDNLNCYDLYEKLLFSAMVVYTAFSVNHRGIYVQFVACVNEHHTHHTQGSRFTSGCCVHTATAALTGFSDG